MQGAGESGECCCFVGVGRDGWIGIQNFRTFHFLTADELPGSN